MDDTRTCYACGFETTEPLKVCAACGYRLRSARTVRRLGWGLVVLGSILVVSMSVLSVIVGRIIIHTDEPGATTTFSSGPEDVALIAGIFGFVIALGAAFVFGGAWQIRYGRPNWPLMAVMFVVAALLEFLAHTLRMADSFGR